MSTHLIAATPHKFWLEAEPDTGAFHEPRNGFYFNAAEGRRPDEAEDRAIPDEEMFRWLQINKL